MSDEDFEFDFGFTTLDEEELKAGEVELQSKVDGLRKMILPLLNNLKKDPDKDIIKWEGKQRIKQIDAFIKKMDDYIKS